LDVAPVLDAYDFDAEEDGVAEFDFDA